MHYVVKNHEDQYSIWPVGRELPKGWEIVGEPATKEECLIKIKDLWQDITPRSVREQLAQLRSSSRPI